MLATGARLAVRASAPDYITSGLQLRIAEDRISTRLTTEASWHQVDERVLQGSDVRLLPQGTSQGLVWESAAAAVVQK